MDQGNLNDVQEQNNVSQIKTSFYYSASAIAY
jgi:hypothetical protein